MGGNIRANLKEENEERQCIIELQKKFELDEIDEDELSDEEREKMSKLYNEQIGGLKRQIEEDKKEIATILNKIKASENA